MSFRLPLQISRAVNLTAKSSSVHRTAPLCTSWVTLAKRSPTCYKSAVDVTHDNEIEVQEPETEIPSTNKTLQKLRELKKKDETCNWYVDNAYLQPKKLESSGKLPSSMVTKYPSNVHYNLKKEETESTTIKTAVGKRPTIIIKRKFSTDSLHAGQMRKSISDPLLSAKYNESVLNLTTPGERNPSKEMVKISETRSSRNTGKKSDENLFKKRSKEVRVEGTVYSEKFNRVRKQFVNAKKFFESEQKSRKEKTNQQEAKEKQKPEKKTVTYASQEEGAACFQDQTDRVEAIKRKFSLLSETSRAKAEIHDKSQNVRPQLIKKGSFIPKPNFYSNCDESILNRSTIVLRQTKRFEEAGKRWKHTQSNKCKETKTKTKNIDCDDCCDNCPTQPRAPALKKLKPQYDASKMERQDKCHEDSCPPRLDDTLEVHTGQKGKLPSFPKYECQDCCEECTMRPEIPKLKRLKLNTGKDRTWSYDDCKKDTCPDRADAKVKIAPKKLPVISKSGDCSNCCEECVFKAEVPNLKRLKISQYPVDRSWKPTDCPHKKCPPRMDDLLKTNVVLTKTLPKLPKSADCKNCCEECELNPNPPELKRLKRSEPLSDRSWKPTDCPHSKCPPRMDKVLGLKTVHKELPPLPTSRDCVECCQDCTPKPTIPDLKRLCFSAQIDRSWKPTDCPHSRCPPRMDVVLGINKISQKTLPKLPKSPDCIECCEDCVFIPETPPLKRLCLEERGDSSWKPSDCPKTLCPPRADDTFVDVRQKKLPSLIQSNDCVPCCEDCTFIPKIPELKRLEMGEVNDRSWKPSDCPRPKCPPRMDVVLGFDTVSKRTLPKLPESSDCRACCEDCTMIPEIPELKRLNCSDLQDRSWKPSDCPNTKCPPRMDTVLGLNPAIQRSLPSLPMFKDCKPCCSDCTLKPEIPELKRLSYCPTENRSWKPSDCPMKRCPPRMDEVLGLHTVTGKTLPKLVNRDPCIKCCEECTFNPEIPELKRLKSCPNEDRSWKPSDCPRKLCPPRMDDLLGIDISIKSLPKLENSECKDCCPDCTFIPEIPELKRLCAEPPADRSWKPSDCPKDACPPRMDMLLGLNKPSQKTLPTLSKSMDCVECCEDCVAIPEIPQLKRLVTSSCPNDRMWKPSDCPMKLCPPRMDELLGVNVVKEKKLPLLMPSIDCEDCCQDCVVLPKEAPLVRLKPQYDPMNMKKTHTDCPQRGCQVARMDDLLGVRVESRQLPPLQFDNCVECCEDCLLTETIPELKRLEPKYDTSEMKWKHKNCEAKKCPPRMDELLGMNVVHQLKLPDLAQGNCEECCDICPQEVCHPGVPQKLLSNPGTVRRMAKAFSTAQNISHLHVNMANQTTQITSVRTYATKSSKKPPNNGKSNSPKNKLRTFPSTGEPRNRNLQPVHQKTSEIEIAKEPPPKFFFVASSEQKRCRPAGESDPLPAKNRNDYNCPKMKLKGCEPPAREDCTPDFDRPECKKVQAPFKSFSDHKPYFADPEMTEDLIQEKILQKLQESGPRPALGKAPEPPKSGDDTCVMGKLEDVPPGCGTAAPETAEKAEPDEEKKGSILKKCIAYCVEKIKGKCKEEGCSDEQKAALEKLKSTPAADLQKQIPADVKSEDCDAQCEAVMKVVSKKSSTPASCADNKNKGDKDKHKHTETITPKASSNSGGKAPPAQVTVAKRSHSKRTGRRTVTNKKGIKAEKQRIKRKAKQRREQTSKISQKNKITTASKTTENPTETTEACIDGLVNNEINSMCKKQSGKQEVSCKTCSDSKVSKTVGKSTSTTSPKEESKTSCNDETDTKEAKCNKPEYSKPNYVSTQCTTNTGRKVVIVEYDEDEPGKCCEKSSDKDAEVCKGKNKSLVKSICEYFLPRKDCPSSQEMEKLYWRKKAYIAARKAGLELTEPPNKCKK